MPGLELVHEWYGRLTVMEIGGKMVENKKGSRLPHDKILDVWTAIQNQV